MKLLCALLIVCASQAPLLGQDSASLRPTRPFPVPGGQLEVRLQRGAGSDASTLPFPRAEQRNWVFLRSPGSQNNFQEVPTLGDEAQRGQLALPAGDYQHEGVVVGLDLKPTVTEVPLGDWERFQVQRLGRAKPEPFSSAFEAPQRVRLRRIESTKLLVRLKEGKQIPVPSGVLMTKTGQAVELRPLADPTTIAPGGDFPVKVYTPAGSPAGLVVTASHEESGSLSRAVTRPGGVAYVRISAAGAWLLEVHEVVPLDGHRDADLELRSASLRFTSPAVVGELEREGDGR